MRASERAGNNFQGFNLVLALLLLLLVFGHSTTLLMLAEAAHPLRRAIAVLTLVGIVGHVGEHMRSLGEMFARLPLTQKGNGANGSVRMLPEDMFIE
jgi:multidrug transporter EmrE-like cation transporter